MWVISCAPAVPSQPAGRGRRAGFGRAALGTAARQPNAFRQLCDDIVAQRREIGLELTQGRAGLVELSLIDLLADRRELLVGLLSKRRRAVPRILHPRLILTVSRGTLEGKDRFAALV